MVVKKPKKKLISKKKEVVECPEPVRISALDILKRNIKLADRVTFVHRLMYVGVHNCPTSSLVGYSYQDVVEEVNDDYCQENLTGFLVYYNKYFCHVIEGSDDALQKHLYVMSNNPTINEHVLQIKLISITHNIGQRFLDFWTTFTAKAPNLMEKIDPDADAKVTNSKILYCIDKLYKLGISLRPVEIDPDAVVPITAIPHTREICGQTVLRSFANARASSMSSDFTLMDYLPETGLLEFLMQSKHVMDLELYISLNNHIIRSTHFKDLTHPTQHDYIPRNVFDADFDPITDLPPKPNAVPLLNI